MFQRRTGLFRLKQPGLQRKVVGFGLDFPWLCKSQCDSGLARKSMFSFLSEILEKHWEPTRGWRERLTEGSCRLPAQNLTEIPPRNERPIGATSNAVSPLLVLD